jgi:hypothetical protein
MFGFKKKPIKSCADCKWFTRFEDEPTFSGKGYCHNSVVTFSTTEYARRMKNYIGGCGKSAEYFEPK